MKTCPLPAKRQDRAVSDLGGAVAELLEVVRRRFYAQQPPTHFHRDRRMLVYALTWPAGWLDSRGLTYSPARTVLLNTRHRAEPGELTRPGFIKIKSPGNSAARHSNSRIN